MSLLLDIQIKGTSTIQIDSSNPPNSNTYFIDGIGKLTFIVTDLRFEKRVYEPCHIRLEVDSDLQMSNWPAFKEAFHEASVRLYKRGENGKEDEAVIGESYFVYSIVPKFFGDTRKSTIVVFEMFSRDKKLTLDKFSHAYTARKLYDDLMKGTFADRGGELLKGTDNGEIQDLLKKSEVAIADKETPKSGGGDDKNRKLVCKPQFLTYVRKDSHGNTVESEYIQPYMVQYNESLYDLLARVACRCGEFLYFEEGHLCLGLPAADGEAKEIGGYVSVSCADTSAGVVADSVKEQSRNSTDAQESLYATPDYAYHSEAPHADYLSVLEKETLHSSYGDLWKAKWANKLIQYLTVNVLPPQGLSSKLKAMADVGITEVKGLAGVKSDNESADKNYFAGVGEEQTNSGKDAVAPFSTLGENVIDSLAAECLKREMLSPEFYEVVKQGEQYVSQNVCEVDLGINFVNVKVGDSVKLDGTIYVVAGMEGWDYTRDTNNYCGYRLTLLPTFPVAYTVKNNDKEVQKEQMLRLPPRRGVAAPRRSAPQLAYIASNKDPQGMGRVRIRYPWQKKSGDASPWIRMVTAFATGGEGIYFQPQVGDEVLVDYEHGDVESPYVSGSLFSARSKTPTGSRTSAAANGVLPSPNAVISSANGHSIRFTDPAGGQAFLQTFSPAWSLLKSVSSTLNPDFMQDANGLAGSMELTDRYGLYSINLSSTERKVAIKSALGDVTIDAFTGIKISAPNGKISIEGKDIEIKARNKLSVTSGTNIDSKLSPSSLSMWGFVEALGDAGIDIFVNRLKVIDLSVLRAVIESFTLPSDGTMKLKSYRNLRMEAGKGETVLKGEEIWKDETDITPDEKMRNIYTSYCDWFESCMSARRTVLTSRNKFVEAINDAPKALVVRTAENEKDNWLKSVINAAANGNPRPLDSVDFAAYGFDKVQTETIKNMSARLVNDVQSFLGLLTPTGMRAFVKDENGYALREYNGDYEKMGNEIKGKLETNDVEKFYLHLYVSHYFEGALKEVSKPYLRRMAFTELEKLDKEGKLAFFVGRYKNADWSNDKEWNHFVSSLHLESKTLRMKDAFGLRSEVLNTFVKPIKEAWNWNDSFEGKIYLSDSNTRTLHIEGEAFKKQSNATIGTLKSILRLF